MKILRGAIALALACSCLVPLAASAAPRAKAKGGAPYSVPTDVLDAALDCAEGQGKGEPVLLVHGTGVNRRLNFEWNLWPALQAAGFDVCWVELPDASMADIQVAAEYVARAFEVIYQRTGEKVDVIGHSQGGLQPRWAIKWFSSGRYVDDYIGLASPNHGTIVADGSTMCFEACLQMKTTSMFIDALNRGDETPGKISYTNIYTTFDELVQPTGTQALEGGANILIQDVCPGRPVDHVSIVADAVTYELIIGALVGRGTADPAKLPADICTRGQAPGTTYPPPDAFPPDWNDGTFTSEEPPLKPYAR